MYLEACLEQCRHFSPFCRLGEWTDWGGGDGNPSTEGGTKGGEAPELLEACIHVHPLLPPFRLLQAPLWVLCPMQLGMSVHKTHVVNTTGPILPEVIDRKVDLLFPGISIIFCWGGF